jgi:hypothetical protein
MWLKATNMPIRYRTDLIYEIIHSVSRLRGSPHQLAADSFLRNQHQLHPLKNVQRLLNQLWKTDVSNLRCRLFNNYAFPEMLRRFCQPIVSDTFWSGAREPEYRTKSSDMCEQMVKLHDGNGLEKIDNAAPSFTI